MGVDYTVYVGPYFTCENEKVQQGKSISICATETCKFRPPNESFKYCPRCGNEIVIEMEDDWIWKVNVGEIYEKLEDRLSEMGPDRREPFNYWVPNFNFKDRRKTSFGDYWCGAVVITPEEIEVETGWLASNFPVEFEALKCEYGQNKVKIEWGVIGDAR